MARYFLHLHERGEVFKDEDGVERPSMEAVRADALEAARSVMAAEVHEDWLCLSGYIEVEDEAGTIVLMMPFSDAVSVRPDLAGCR